MSIDKRILSIAMRVERVKSRLERRHGKPIVLVYVNGESRSMPIVEALTEVADRGRDIVDVLSKSETTRSLLLGLRGPWDFSEFSEFGEL